MDNDVIYFRPKVMTRIAILLLLLGTFITGCDLLGGQSEPDPIGEVEATLNEGSWYAFPIAAVVYTEDVYVPQNDSMLTMQFDAMDIYGFRQGAMLMTFPFRGIGPYDIDRSEIAEPDTTETAAPDTLLPIVAFYDVQQNTINAHFLIAEEEPFHVTVDEVDRRQGEIRGTFSGTFVFADGRAFPSPFRNYPDTLRFTNGTFRSTLQFATAQPE